MTPPWRWRVVWHEPGRRVAASRPTTAALHRAAESALAHSRTLRRAGIPAWIELNLER